MLVDHMAKPNPYETFAAVINTCRDTLYEWEKKHTEFSDAKKRGRAKQYQALFTLGMAGTTGRLLVNSGESVHKKYDKKGNEISSTTTTHKMNGFSTGGWVFMMKNCAGWRDRLELTEDDQVDTMDFEGAK